MRAKIHKNWQKGEHAIDTKASTPSQPKKHPKERGTGMTPVGLSLPDPYVQALLLMYPGKKPAIAARMFILSNLQPYKESTNDE